MEHIRIHGHNKHYELGNFELGTMTSKQKEIYESLDKDGKAFVHTCALMPKYKYELPQKELPKFATHLKVDSTKINSIFERLLAEGVLVHILLETTLMKFRDSKSIQR